jgi:hypothetical protein
VFIIPLFGITANFMYFVMLTAKVRLLP